MYDITISNVLRLFALLMHAECHHLQQGYLCGIITNFQNNEDIYSFVDEKNDKQDSYDVKMIEFSTQILLAITADGFLEC